MKIRSDFILINEKNNGGLFIPSSDLIKLCKVAETEVRISKVKGVHQMKNSGIVSRIVRTCRDSNIFKTGDEKAYLCDHTFEFIRDIAKLYVKIRVHHITKEATLAMKPTTNRNACTKAVHFEGN